MSPNNLSGFLFLYKRAFRYFSYSTPLRNSRRTDSILAGLKYKMILPLTVYSRHKENAAIEEASMPGIHDTPIAMEHAPARFKKAGHSGTALRFYRNGDIRTFWE